MTLEDALVSGVGGSALAAVAMLAGGIGVGVGCAALSAKLRRGFRAPDDIASLVGIKGFETPGVVSLTAGGCAAVLEMTGERRDDVKEEEVAAAVRLRSAAVKRLWDAGCMTRLIARRRRVDLTGAGGEGEGVVRELHRAAVQALGTVYETRRYLVIERGGSAGGLEDAVKEASVLLKQFGARSLEGPELYEFLVCGFDDGAIDGAIVSNDADGLLRIEPEFDGWTGRISYATEGGTRWLSVVGVPAFGSSDKEGVIDGIVALPVELTVCLLGRPVKRLTVGERLEKRSGQQQARRANSLVGRELSEVLALVDADIASVGSCGLVVVVPGWSPQEVDAGVNAVKEVLARRDYRAKPERLGVAPQFLSTLPGHPGPLRPRDLTSANIGGLWNWTAEPRGMEGSLFGPGAIRFYRTAGGAPYRLQWHLVNRKRAKGHGYVIGSNDAGKTTAVLHMLGGMMRFDPAPLAFILDRFHGMYAWCEAVGGQYVNPLGAGLAPLAGEDSAQERLFVRAWLGQLCHGIEGADEAIAKGVDALFKVPAGKRSMPGTLRSAFAAGPVRDRLEDLCGEGTIFAAAKDGLSIGDKPVVLDCTHLTERPEVLAAALSLGLHRLRVAAGTGRPHVVILEEAGALLDVPGFDQVAKVAYREHRKLGGAVVMMVQEPGVLVGSSVSRIVVENSAWSLIFPAPGADRAELAALGVQGEHLNFVLGDHPAHERLKRPALFRRGREGVILEMDLSGLGPWLKVYDGGPEVAARVAALKEKEGGKWLDAYLK